jgi:hypothetical protein
MEEKMNSISSIPLLIALITTAGIASSQPSSPTGSGDPKDLGTAGLLSAAPNTTGGTHTPNTSASGATVKCPPAQARSIESASGSAGTGSSSGPSRPRDIATKDDCAAVGASGASGSKSDSRSPDSVSERSGITDTTDPFKGTDRKPTENRGKEKTK